MSHYSLLFSLFLVSTTIIPISFIPNQIVLAQESQKTQADKLFQEALRLVQIGQFSESIRLAQITIKIYQQMDDQIMLIRAYSVVALAYTYMNNYSKAIAYYDKCLMIAKKNNDRSAIGLTYNGLGIVYKLLGQYETALKYHQDTLTIAKELKLKMMQSGAYSGLGNVYYALHNYPKAIEYYQAGLAIAIEKRDRHVIAEFYNNLGNAYTALHNYPKALEYHELSLKMALQNGNRYGLGIAYNNLGNAYTALSNYPKALEYYQKSLQIAQQIQARDSQRAAYNNIGNIYKHLTNYPKAIEYNLLALNLAKEIKDRRYQGEAYNNLGAAYTALNNHQKAIEYYQESLIIAQEINDRLAILQAYNNLGASYAALKNHQKAIEYYQPIIKIYQQRNDPKGTLQVYNNLGVSYTGLNNYQKAIEYYEQSLAIAKKIKDRTSEAQLYNNLGVAYSKLNISQRAIEYSQKGLALATEINDPVAQGIAYNNLGYTLLSIQQLPAAEKSLLSAIKVFEKIRLNLTTNDQFKINLFEQHSESYKLLQLTLIAQNKIDSALEIAERGRARAFVDLISLRTGIINPNKFLPPSPINIAQIKNLAKQQNATLVNYSVILNQIYIWVIYPSGEIHFRKIEKGNLKELLESSRVAAGTNRNRGHESIGNIAELTRGILVDITSNNNARVSWKKLKETYQLLIKPIVNLLPTDPDAKIIFIPHEDLFLVPFAALQDEEDKYLIEKHTIQIAPSLQILSLIKTRGNINQADNILIVGNPKMPTLPGKTQPESPLPGSESEAILIADIFKVRPLIGDIATESTVTQQLVNAKIIHLATHGFLTELDKLNSTIPGAIALTPSDKDDGLLTSDEISQLKLNAHLVVLSACNTGRGNINSDGIVGLSRAFVSAGVSNLLASLWYVPDDATQILMVEFYQNWQIKKQDQAIALRQAMLTTMKKYPAPKAWAGFFLMGSGL